MMKKLREIAVGVPFGSTVGKELNLESICTAEMYFRQIRGVKIGEYAKVNILLVPSSEDQKEDFLIANTIDTYKVFDFECYQRSSEFGRKELVLATLHSTLKSLAKGNLEVLETLSAAETYCRDHQIQNSFKLQVKGVRSKALNLFGEIHCEWGMEVFHAYAVFLDLDGNPISRKLLVELPSYSGEFIYYAKPFWENSEFILRSKDGKEWRASPT